MKNLQSLKWVCLGGHSTCGWTDKHPGCAVKTQPEAPVPPHLWVDLLLKIIFTTVCPHHAACGTFLPQPGTEPAAPAVEVQSLNHWITRDIRRRNFCSASLFSLSGDEVTVLNNLYQNITGLQSQIIQKSSPQSFALRKSPILGGCSLFQPFDGWM